MDAKYVRDRITQLRLQKGVSEYQMSYDLGHSRGYINNISSGKVLPSMNEFFAICDYFQITPQLFFDTGTSHPKAMENIQAALKGLDPEDFQLIQSVVERLRKKEK